MQRVKVGVIGAGGVAQVEHMPNLLKLKGHFEVIGVYDPSRTVRAFVDEEFGLRHSTISSGCSHQPLDAVVIASPDALHKEHMLAAFARACMSSARSRSAIGVDDIDELIAARDQAGKVLQVGYMKRFDPSYEAALQASARHGADAALRLGRGERPGCLALHPSPRLARGDDVPAELIAAAADKQREQVARAVPGLDDADDYQRLLPAPIARRSCMT